MDDDNISLRDSRHHQLSLVILEIPCLAVLLLSFVWLCLDDQTAPRKTQKRFFVLLYMTLDDVYVYVHVGLRRWVLCTTLNAFSL